MRARLARPRRIVRGRLVAPVAAAAAVALVGGVVVATPDAPTVREDVQTVATVVPGLQVGAEFSYNLNDLGWTGSLAGFQVETVSGLPEGLEFEEGVISGTPTAAGGFDVVVNGTMGGADVSHTIRLVVADAEGNIPAGAEAGSSGAVQGSLGGEAGAEAGGQIITGSEGADALLGAVASIVVGLGGDAGSVGELATGSTGGTENENPDTPSGPLGSVTESLMGTNPDNGEPNPGEQTPGSDSLGSSATGEAGGDVTGDLNTESLGPLGSLIDTETGTETGSNAGGETNGEGGIEVVTEGEASVPGSSVPGSTTTGTTGSLGDLAPGLALTGAALLGLAGLSIVLNGGSSSLPALLGSSTGGTTGSGPGSSGSRPGGSSGSVAPTVAAGSPAKVKEAPGPTVANGRG